MDALRNRSRHKHRPLAVIAVPTKNIRRTK
jgi:hypothetical protein